MHYFDFHYSWEQRKLSEIATMHARIGWQNLRTSEFLDSGDYMLITGTDFIDGAVNFDTCHYVERERYEQDKHIQIRNGSILITKDGTLGKVAYIQGLTMPATLNAGVFNVEIKDENEVDNRYLFQYLKAPFLMDYVDKKATGGTIKHLNQNILVDFPVVLPHKAEQEKIGEYFLAIDHLITLHQRKCQIDGCRFQSPLAITWEQRKLIEVCDYVDYRGKTPTKVDNGIFLVTAKNVKAGYIDYESSKEYISEDDYEEVMHRGKPEIGDVLITTEAPCGNVAQVNTSNIALAQRIIKYRGHKNVIDNTYLKHYMLAPYFQKILFEKSSGGTVQGIKGSILHQQHIIYPMYDEQLKIGEYFDSLDDLITLHQRKCNELKKLKQHMANHMFVNHSIKCDRDIATNHKKLQERTKEMGELESVIEQRLIDQLCGGDSQWTYRKDIRTEEQLWDNFKYILEQNNKAKLNDTPLSDSEFAKIKNDVSHASFYDAGKWQVGENGKVYVHVQRGNETLHLVVMNNEHIAGGTSVYEVINQYQAFKTDEVDDKRDRRFDVTLLINGIPMIHIELKNKDHSYMDGYRQIEKYISEGKFRGLFSNIQMFVVSNAVDTKYFAAARAAELAEGKKFITGWVDNENYPVCDYLDFAKAVLRIPQAHEMIAKYTVLDNEKKKLLILRPYQIHAIEAMRAASKRSISGYIWHTTGSGKTMTSYKATRNLLMDIPSIEKTIFLIDRKDLDMQTKMAFQSYADNDTIDVDDTENVDALIRRLTDGNRQMIVTTRQKLQTMIAKRLQEGTKEYDKIRNLRVAFVVDECHRAVTPETKRKIERFFAHSLWYGFTGTPIFEENRYEQKGDLPQTTDELYGACLHSYTIKNAIHDEAVLGFMVENLGPKKEDVDDAVFETEEHMRQVLDVVLNQSYTKLGMQNGKGRTYEGILTVGSIAKAQRYYELLKRIKAGKDALKINEEICKVVPDFPKFAITYSVTENDEASTVNQDKMRESLQDYNAMFGTHYDIENINAYNSNLNDRLARKEKRYMERSQQLDLVIVVNRLLTGFDAPCLSTLYMDRSPMSPQDIIQAFSRTNRLFDANKTYGQVVTFQSPKDFKKEIDRALRLYSRGGEGVAVSEDWESVLDVFSIDVKTIHALGRTPEEISQLSREQKKSFIYAFRSLDKSFAHLKAFSRYREELLADYDFSQEEYENYAAMYKNVMEELKKPKDEAENDDPVMDDYDLIAYSKMRVDFEYIVELLQGLVNYLDQSSNDFQDAIFAKNILALREISKEFAEDNQKLGELLEQVIDNIEQDKDRYKGQDIAVVVNQMRYDAIDTEIKTFAKLWNLNEDDVRYEVYNYRDGEMANENTFKDRAYASYKEGVEEPMPKFKFRKIIVEKFKHDLMENVLPLRD